MYEHKHFFRFTSPRTLESEYIIPYLVITSYHLGLDIYIFRHLLNINSPLRTSHHDSLIFPLDFPLAFPIANLLYKPLLPFY